VRARRRRARAAGRRPGLRGRVRSRAVAGRRSRPRAGGGGLDDGGAAARCRRTAAGRAVATPGRGGRPSEV
ncbi:MAG: hypothetical protein AVDCRST_MAG52-2934, partial [uncultured Blastococcus sp.]